MKWPFVESQAKSFGEIFTLSCHKYCASLKKTQIKQTKPTYRKKTRTENFIMEKIAFSTGFLRGTGKRLNAPCSVFLWLLFLPFQNPPTLPLLLSSAKFPHQFPSWFLSQFPTHTVVHEYITNSQGKR